MKTRRWLQSIIVASTQPVCALPWERPQPADRTDQVEKPRATG